MYSICDSNLLKIPPRHLCCFFSRYDVEPRVLHVRIVNSHLTSGNDFKVTGYSVQGRVLTHENGQPVAGRCDVVW